MRAYYEEIHELRAEIIRLRTEAHLDLMRWQTDKLLLLKMLSAAEARVAQLEAAK